MVIIIILLLIIGFLLFKLLSPNKGGNMDLSMAMNVYPSDDKGYIKHMIKHHQVAVDMSEHLLKYTKDPRMILLCRDIIWLQKYEIWQMKNMLESKPYVSLLTKPRTKIYSEPPTMQIYYPEQSSAEQSSDNEQKDMHSFIKPTFDRATLFPDGDNPLEQIKTHVNEGYYPNNPPLDDPHRNTNFQVRSEPANLGTLPSHWNETTIKPDIYRRPLEVKSF